jgi:hypothetical protein
MNSLVFEFEERKASGDNEKISKSALSQTRF